MQLEPHQQNANTFRELACTAIDLLAGNQFDRLVEDYGYASAFAREPVMAVRSDLAKALSSVSGTKLLAIEPADISIVLYEENLSFIRAAIDCEVPTQDGSCVWISFVVTATGTELFLTLEDICAEQGSD